MSRPRNTQKDDNHFIPRDYLRDRCGGYEVVRFGRTTAYTANFRGYKFILYDLANYGGVFSDWLLEAENGRLKWIEVKTEAAFAQKERGLKPGEKWLQENSNAFKIVVTDEAFGNLLEYMIEPLEERTIE